MTNNSSKRLAELAGRFEKLAQVSNFNQKQSGYGDQSDKKGLTEQNTKWPDGLKVIVRKLEVAAKRAMSSWNTSNNMYGTPDSQGSNIKENLTPFFNTVKELDRYMNELKKVYFTLDGSTKSLINVLCTRAASLLNKSDPNDPSKNLSSELTSRELSDSNSEILNKLLQGDTAVWIRNKAVSGGTSVNPAERDAFKDTTASLREVHKMLKSASGNGYELSAREIAKLKALVKSI